MQRKDLIVSAVEKNKSLMLDAERWLWAHPQTGYTEWQAHEYLAGKFEELGYEITPVGNIPGFYTDVDTGKKGPTLYIMGELDALDIANHAEAVDGMSHACGHHAQVSTLLGIAAVLKEDGMLDGMCGKIRLIAVPAEEMIQLDYRESLREKGTVSYMAGKVELMRRGFFGERGLAIMVHTNTNDDGIEFKAALGFHGCILKTFKYKGVASHAGCAAHLGVNAEYAAMLGLQACNDLRETFIDSERTKFHPIMKGVQSSVNIIPDEMIVESYVRSKTIGGLIRENKKINRALAGAAAALGASVELHDRHGSSPEYHDKELMKLAEKCCSELVGEDKVEFTYDAWGSSCSDFGDITAVMPGIQFNAAGALGTCHSIHFTMTEPWRFCKNSAAAQLLIAYELLKDDAEKAESIIANYKPVFESVDDYFKTVDSISLDCDAVKYNDDGTVLIKFT